MYGKYVNACHKLPFKKWRCKSFHSSHYICFHGATIMLGAESVFTDDRGIHLALCLRLVSGD